MNKRNLLKYGLHLVILIGLGAAAAKYLNGEEVLAALRTFQYRYAPWMLLLSAAYLVLKAFRFVPLTRPLSNVGWLTLVKAYLAGTAATLVPGGVAARAGLMDQAGLPVEKSSVPVAFSSILDQAVLITGALLAALWFEGARLPAFALLAILGVTGLIFLIPFTRNLLLRLAEWTARKFGAVEKLHTFLRSFKQVATIPTLLLTFGMTVAALPLLVVILDLSLRGVGLSVPTPTLFLAYILPAILGRNSALPGGVGVTEAGMVGFLASTSGMDADTTAAAVAIFRIATVLFHALLGGLVYFFWWRGEAEEQAPDRKPRAEETQRRRDIPEGSDLADERRSAAD